jgi:PilZ domain-containing protein
MDEKSESPRHRTFKGGTISFDRGIVECTIRNLSETGALLEVGNSIGIPDQFILIIKPETLRRSCEVAWRSEKNIDVKFV